MTASATNSASIGILSDVLCGVDGTKSSYEAVRQAAALAGVNGRLTLLAATAQSGSGRYHASTLAPARASRVLEHAAKLAHEAGVQCETEHAADSSVLDMVLAYASRHRLLALGAPSMSRLGHLFVGGVATSASHVLPSALLIARTPPSGLRVDERILVASDAMEHSDELVDFAVRLAQARESSLVLFHAPGAEAMAHPTRMTAQSERVREVLGDRASVHVQPGRAHREIVQAAEAEHASLIVLVSRGASGLRALGSVSERVVHDAPCSVLVLRPEDLADGAGAVASATAGSGRGER